MLTSSSFVFEKTRLQTYEPVLIVCSGFMLMVSQKRMHWSAVPPPVASKPRCSGLQLMALTAAWWSLN